MFSERGIKTKNGVAVYEYRNPSLHGFHISLFLRAGSMLESQPGITHFLEHTAIRNVGAVMKGQLYPTLDKYGLDFNASTYSEMVQFYIAGSSSAFDLGAAIIARLLSPIVLSAKEISAERERIKAEIRESDDATSLSSFSNNIVHEGTTLSNMITGALGSVNKINGRLLEEYRRSVMTAENIFFYVTGNFTDENLKSLSREIEKYSLESGKMTENLAPVCAHFGRREPKVYIKNADFTMLRFSFDMDMTEMTMAESDIIYDMLFSGYNSRFFMEMSEKRGLFYDVSGSSERYKNIGTLTFSFEVRGGSIYDAAETAVGLLREFKETLPEEDSMMKAGYVTNAELLYDDARELNFTFAYDNHIMNCGYKSVFERAGVYASVTPDRVREVAGIIFRPENLTLAVKGNKKRIDTPKLEEIIKRL